MSELITPEVHDEFGTLECAVTWGGTDAKHTAQALGMTESAVRQGYFLQNPPEYFHEHYSFTELLRREGVHLLHPKHPHPDTSKMFGYFGDELFCRDFIGTVDDIVIRTRLFEDRMRNHMHYEAVLKQVDPKQVHDSDIEFSWGNGMLYDDLLLVSEVEDDAIYEALQGKSQEEQLSILRAMDGRQNGPRRLSQLLEQLQCKRRIEKIQTSCDTDIDFAVAPLPVQHKGGKRMVLVQPEVVTLQGIQKLQSIFDVVAPVLDSRASLPTNILWLNPETALIAENARGTQNLLADLGYNVNTIPMSGVWSNIDNLSNELGGGWRCAIAPIRRQNDYVG